MADRNPGTLREITRQLRTGEISAAELAEAALARHAEHGHRLHAYKHFDAKRAREAARLADARLARADPPPLCGIPISVKDIYGVSGMPTFAGSARQLPAVPWSQDAWLVARLRAAGAVIVGKTHTVEFAYGGVGINPHWGTPWNPWDPELARIPGGSSCGAGVSLWEGSALLALGSDTGGSIRIPAAFTGVVGHKTTKGRWPTDGVVQLSSTFDTIGALTRSVEDSIYFFGSVDPKWGDPESLLESLETTSVAGLKLAIPACGAWTDCQADIADVLRAALAGLETAGTELLTVDGQILDDATDLYMRGGIGRAECHAFLTAELPEWLGLLHPTVGTRLAGAAQLDSDDYRNAIAEQRGLAASAAVLFEHAAVLVLPGNMITPPPVSNVVEGLEEYVRVNAATLRPTCPVNLLELCAVSIPVGLDSTGMPVGLQLVARGGDDESLLGAAWAVQRHLGTDRIGHPPLP